MQTFLPYPSFSESAKVLDNKRLGKQRVEAYQILRALCGESTGWQHHPAVKMWKGFEWALWSYGQDICIEWIRRGFKDTVLTKLEGMEGYKVIGETRFKKPGWLHDTAFHSSHRSNLLRKDPIHYGQFGWTEGNSLPYVWPTKIKGE
jgi:hypothetical protein